MLCRFLTSKSIEMMPPLKHVTKARAFFSSILMNNSVQVPTALSCLRCLSASTSSSAHGINYLSANQVVGSFKHWFKSRNNALFDKIYEILNAQAYSGDELAAIYSTDFALSQLGLRLSESFVLEVLAYGNDVLSCLKFFDWAGRQPGFYHTYVTFNAIFKILSRAKLIPLMFDFLASIKKQRYAHIARFNDILVIGYSVAGKPEIALQVFGRMRYGGLDLDYLGYHVLLNALVEENCFDAVWVILKQMQIRGYQNEVTNAIIMKNYCKQDLLDEAEAFLNGLICGSKSVLSGREVSVLVASLCKKKKFEQAGKLIWGLQNSGLVSLVDAYTVWIKELVGDGRLDEALGFFQQKRSLEGCDPGPYRYNRLICTLLRNNRLLEVYDLLMEMKEKHITPDVITMNAVLCFFCKAGMVDVAFELYSSRSEFGLSPNHMAYKYLIRSLMQDGQGSITEAYDVLQNSICQGCFPDRETFSIVVDALCREGKVDEMNKLLIIASGRNYMPSTSTYDKYISALCRAKRVEDAYLIFGELNNVSSRYTYSNLIRGFSKLNRGDIAAQLLIEMQERGHIPTRFLVRVVIHHLLEMNNPRTRFWNFLEMQLSRHDPSCQMYNYFIDGAGHAKRPELAREVFEIMLRNGVKPNLSSKILMMQSYLKSGRISDALNFFSDLHNQGMVGKKLYNSLIVGLCKANKADLALDFFWKMRNSKITPSIDCYEILVQELCRKIRYFEAVNLVLDYEKMGRHLTSFLGNIFLFHSLSGSDLYNTCVRLIKVKEEFSGTSLLCLLIGAFSGRLKVYQDTENLEELIEKCFPLDTYTCNMLLRKVSTDDMDQACGLFNRMCQKGYRPNRWTYDIMLHGFFKHGRKVEAQQWAEEMFLRGFYPTKRTSTFI